MLKFKLDRSKRNRYFKRCINAASLIYNRVVEIPFTPRAKRVLELAEEESDLLGHNYIGTEHLLLGTIGVEDGIALRVLENLGVDSTKIRPLVVRMLGENTQVSNASVSSPRDLLDRLRRQDSIAAVEDREIIELLRSIAQNTSAIVQSLNTLNQNMTVLCGRVEQIEGKLSS